MDVTKILGYTVYAIGIVGGVQGVFKSSIPISIVAIVVIVVGSVLLGVNTNENPVSS
ncbi:MAG: hypothetical protein KAJ51_10200 [Thermoplasmata archaeon]|nr:hypothetical protein [Thermoplasmata archaeon]